MKIQIKLNLNCPRALAISRSSHKGQNCVQRKAFKFLTSSKQVGQLSCYLETSILECSDSIGVNTKRIFGFLTVLYTTITAETFIVNQDSEFYDHIGLRRLL